MSGFGIVFLLKSYSNKMPYKTAKASFEKFDFQFYFCFFYFMFVFFLLTASGFDFVIVTVGAKQPNKTTRANEIKESELL